MTDLVERLRRKTVAGVSVWPTPLDLEAADEIERLRAEVKQQRLELGITEDACGMLESEVKQLRADLAALKEDHRDAARNAGLYAEEAGELRARVAELEAERRRPCGDEQDCIWQPRCGMARRCLRPSGGLIAPIESVP